MDMLSGRQMKLSLILASVVTYVVLATTWICYVGSELNAFPSLP
jgi:hypothetical protein